MGDDTSICVAPAVGPELRRLRHGPGRKSRREAAGQRVACLRSREPAGPGRTQAALALSLRAAPAAPARPAPRRQGPRSGVPEDPAPVPRRGDLRARWAGSRVISTATFTGDRSRVGWYHPEHGHEGCEGPPPP